MKHTIRDLRASGYNVVVIIGTSALRHDEWVTAPVFTTDDGTNLTVIWGAHILLCRKEAMALARELWPDAIADSPHNEHLVTAQ